MLNGTNCRDQYVVEEAKFVVSDTQCAIHCFLEFCGHVSEPIEASEEPICSCRFTTEDAEVTMFAGLLGQWELAERVIQIKRGEPYLFSRFR